MPGETEEIHAYCINEWAFVAAESEEKARQWHEKEFGEEVEDIEECSLEMKIWGEAAEAESERVRDGEHQKQCTFAEIIQGNIEEIRRDGGWLVASTEY